MSFESFTGVLASAVGVVIAMSPLLQARRVQRMRDSSEVSVAFFVIIIVGESVWCLRGIVTRDLVILIPNVVALVVGVVTLLVVRHFRPSAPSGASAAPGCAPSPGASAAERRRRRRARLRR